MKIYDPLIHPALMDPRSWGDVDLYETRPPVEREALPGVDHETPDRTFEARHLRLDLHFDDEQEEIAGTAHWTLAPLNDGLIQVELDAAELELTTVRLVAPEPSTVSSEVHAEKLVFELPRAFARGEELTLEIAYRARPRKGLFFIKPDQEYPNKPRQIWSQGENEDAHWWFPCPDVTHQKMTTELLATVRDDFFALSNGALVAISEDPVKHTKTYHWRLEQPHPPYLVSVVAGQYEHLSDHHGELPVDYYVYRDRREAGARLFANTPRMLATFEERFGFAYPYPKYSQILVEDFLFGAMENTSATTMTDRVLLDERAALDLNYDDIVAHELAHQWWGDLVTCKDWTQIWLNESFATYAEYFWRERERGADEARFTLFQDFLTYLHEDLSSHRRPIVCRRYRYSEELMDRHAYEKGACVLDMLRATLGDDGFFRSLAHYLKKHAFGVAETADLKRAIEEATGRNLHWFFAQWIDGAGYPELEVNSDWHRESQMLKLSVVQTQQREEGVQLFRLPVEIEIHLPGEAGTDQRASYRVVVEKEEQEFYFPCAQRPRAVLFDKGHRIFKLMRFPKSAQELNWLLQHDEDALGRLRAARELAAFKSEETVGALRAALADDPSSAVRLGAAIALGEIGNASAREALTAAYAQTGEPRVRRGCVWALGNYRDEEAVAWLGGVLARDESYFVAATAARALAHIGGDRAYDILTDSLSRASWQEVIRAAIFHGFAIAKEKRAVDAAIAHSRYGEPPPLRLAAISCLGALGKELRAEGGDERIVDHLLTLVADRAIRARVAAIRALGKIGNPRALGALRSAEGRECLDQLRGALADAIEALEKKKGPSK